MLTLAVALIVKNEALSITNTLTSVLDVADDIVVFDTGSDDGTVQLVQDWIGDNKVSGSVHTGIFVDYASARNSALQLSTKCKYTMSMSADETLEGGESLRQFLEAYDGTEDAFLVEIRTPTGSFNYPRVLRTNSRWVYKGAIHEEPRHVDDPTRTPTVKIPQVWITYAPTDSVRLAKRLRERDVPLLRAQLAAAAPKTEARARALVLLAQTQEQIAAGCADSVDKTLETLAALGWYIIAAVQEGVPLAQWKALNVSEALGIYTSQEMLTRLQPLAASMPKEPVVAYMVAAHTAGINAKAGLAAAQKALNVAKAAVVDPEHPHDPSGLLWRPYLLMALCAKALQYQRVLVKKYVDAGIAAGGPAAEFAGL